MQIKGSTVLVLGGWGLVGSAICRKLMAFEPGKLIVSSLKKAEAEDAVAQLRREFPKSDPSMFEARWGNIFTRQEWKDENWAEVLKSPDRRKGFIKDIFFELDDNIYKSSALYQLITETKPNLVIDCINTATAIAYLDIYNTTLNTILSIEGGKVDESVVENMMSSSYIPQLIRHVQILNNSMRETGVEMYFKVGTSGTGGMGMNIPYTHSEERPSRVLLSKTAVAGAQTLLLFLMARTPGGPLVKEIKPTATIAWKKIGYGEIKRRGQAIKLVDMPYEGAKAAQGDFVFGDFAGVNDTGKFFESVFIDTGENGIFSRGEFEAISALGQMEIVTPEEIAEYLVHEVRGGNTGHDIMQGLDGFTLGPTYRGGMLRNIAVEKIDKLENENGVASVAFELLGPPRLSKLLYEAHLIKKVCGSVRQALELPAEEISAGAEKILASDGALRAQMLSIGLAVLLSDGKRYLRGQDVKIPVRRGREKLEMTPENVDQWCYEGWVDLRPESFKEWQKRFNDIVKQAEAIPADETGSRYTYTLDYWNNFNTVEEGKIAGWVFEFEDKGWRFKR
ncbi:MAG: short-chain dehydrogenase [Chloroflexota bacterium]